MTNFANLVTISPYIGKIDTTQFFSADDQDTNDSPIDQFFENTILLNNYWNSLRAQEDIAPELSRLLLVGYASAVEGYMRSLIRSLVCVDQFTRDKCASHQLPFAAAIHHKKELLPEALLEEVSFSTEGVIASTLTKFVGINISTSATKKLLDDFNLLMQLRHCCTHRFGKLGVKNAVVLGLGSHSPLLEKQVKLNKKAMSQIADLIFTLVKSVNNEVFHEVMKRSATSRLENSQTVGIGWTWNFNTDRKKFNSYYQIFCSKKNAPQSPSVKDVYNSFKSDFISVGRPKSRIKK